MTKAAPTDPDDVGSPTEQPAAENTHILLNSGEWTAFMKALDSPSKRHPRADRLLKEPTILD